MSHHTTFDETGRCNSCGYDRTGLDHRSACPECGFSADWPVEQARAEGWFASRDGLTAAGMPFAAAVLLTSREAKRIARRRVIIGIVIPLGLAVAIVAVLSSLSSIVVFERWREVDAQPGVHLDSDNVAGRFSALSRHMLDEAPYLPVTVRKGEDYHWRVASRRLIWQPSRPRSTELLSLAGLLTIAGAGYLALVGHARFIARRSRQIFPAGARVHSVVLLSWFWLPLLPALVVELVVISLSAAIDLHALPDGLRPVIAALGWAGKVVHVLLAGMLAARVQAFAPFHLRGLNVSFEWPVRMIAILAVLTVVSYLLFGFVDLRL